MKTLAYPVVSIRLAGLHRRLSDASICFSNLLISSLLIAPLSMFSEAAMADHPTVGVQANPGGPITTASGQVLPKGQLTAAIDFQYIDFDAVSNARLALGSERGEDIHSADSLSRTALNVAFGMSDKLTLGWSLPYIERKGLKQATHGHQESHQEPPTEANHHEPQDDEQIDHLGDASGFGDAQIYGAYQLSAPVNEGSAALLFGLKVPTGETRQKSRGGERLETELQPGSGSWDPFLGLAYSRSWGAWSLDSNILYTLATEGSQSTDLGDIFNYNLSLSRPIYSAAPAGHEGHQHQHRELPSVLSAAFVFEINGEWRDRTESSGETEANSGGNVVYLSPGLSVKAGDWFTGVALGLPVENLNGVQSEPETRLVFRLGRAF